MKKWYDSAKGQNHILISSRVRLSRNLCAYPFSLKLDKDGSRRMLTEIHDKFFQQFEQPSDAYKYYELTDMDSSGKKMLTEQFVITPALAQKKLPAGVIVSKDFSESIMLNEDDHIRIQVMAFGDGLEAAYAQADRLEELLSERMEYAYNKKYGFITSCATSIGTGLRAAYLMHLPFLEKQKLIKPLADELNRLGYVLKGAFDESAQGAVYQLTNQRTLGVSEAEILSSLHGMMIQVADHERKAREHILRHHRQEIEDLVYKSYGVLKYGRSFGSLEAMAHLSNIRYGLDEGIITLSEPGADIFAMMLHILPGTVSDMAGRSLGTVSRHLVRASYIRKSLPDIMID